MNKNKHTIPLHCGRHMLYDRRNTFECVCAAPLPTQPLASPLLTLPTPQLSLPPKGGSHKCPLSDDCLRSQGPPLSGVASVGAPFSASFSPWETGGSVEYPNSSKSRWYISSTIAANSGV